MQPPELPLAPHNPQVSTWGSVRAAGCATPPELAELAPALTLQYQCCVQGFPGGCDKADRCRKVPRGGGGAGGRAGDTRNCQYATMCPALMLLWPDDTVYVFAPCACSLHVTTPSRAGRHRHKQGLVIVVCAAVKAQVPWSRWDLQGATAHALWGCLKRLARPIERKRGCMATWMLLPRNNPRHSTATRCAAPCRGTPCRQERTGQWADPGRG